MSKISELSDGGALQSTDYLIAVRSGGNVKVQANGNLSLGTVTADGLTVDGDALFTTNTATNPFVVSRVGNTTESLQITFDDSSTILTSEQDEAGRYGGYVFNSKNDGTTLKRMEIAHTTGDISFYEDTGTTAKFFWDASAERLGIGTTSPGHELVVEDIISPRIYINDSGGTSSDVNSLIAFSYGSETAAGYLGYNGDDDLDLVNSTSLGSTIFSTNNTEAMRIDSSQNLLVGKTTLNAASVGHEIRASGEAIHTRDSASPLTLNRETNDGDIAVFRKDNATVGAIGAQGGYLTIGQSGTTDAFLSFTGVSQAAIRPASSTGANSDNTTDLGATSARFTDIYATNGTIQTSDVNEKENIRELLEAEARVAQAAKGLLRAFQWKDSVAEKGDEARIHFGIIAQDLEAAFEAEGLDAGRYAMFIHSTWTDEETGEERSRMGVRYSELLAFIIAAL